MLRILLFLIPAALVAQVADPGAPPLGVSDKLIYHTKRIIEPTEFLRVGVSAGFQQFLGTPDEWGQGAEGYGRRYASSFGSNVLRQSITFGLVAALREDPRFFMSGKTGFGERLKSALTQTLICHTDSGGRSFAFGRVGGAFGSELISNTWRPKSVNTTGDALSRASSTLAVTAGTNVFREFLPEIKKLFKH
ncbi:MAG: hypothetical protein M3Z36_14780 [Acidobacteriota bacterium]|nr:hypothetical protein [Acidobacteriota bacterium]